MIKHFMVGVSVLVLGLTGTALATPDKAPKEDKKVTICHATSAVQNQWVRTVVSENATAGHFDNNGTAKAGHEGDKLLQGDVACPEVPVVITPPKECPTGTTLVDYKNGDKQQPICKGEPTGCPYGDSIPVDSPKCVPPTETKGETPTETKVVESTTPTPVEEPVYEEFQGK